MKLDEKTSEIWERCKAEVPEKQFLKLVWLRNRLKELGWKNAHTDKLRSVNGNIVIEATAPGVRPYKHWFQVGMDGDCIPLPCEMRCK